MTNEVSLVLADLTRNGLEIENIAFSQTLQELPHPLGIVGLIVLFELRTAAKLHKNRFICSLVVTWLAKRTEKKRLVSNRLSEIEMRLVQ